MTIFLSYARDDEAIVKTMARAFEAAEREIWYDHDLRGGDIWWPTIVDHIRSCSVFLFALSDHSLVSRACLEELDYAEKLARPVLPVRVGPVVKQQTNPLAQRQFVQFRADDAVSAFKVLAAADRSAERCPPLPVPLPAEPPIPFAYLQQITHQIDAGELSPRAQLDVITELRRAIAEESERAVRQEIVAILRLLLTKPWRTYAAGMEIQATLAAYRAMEEEIERLAGTSTEADEQPRPDDTATTAQAGPRASAPDPGADADADAGAHSGAEAHPDPPPTPPPGAAPDSQAASASGPASAHAPDPPAAGGPAPDPGPNLEEVFLARVQEIDARRRGPTARTPASDSTGTSEEIFARRTEEVFQQLRAGAAVRQAIKTAPDSEADHEPPPFPGVGHAEWSSAPEAEPSAPTDTPAGHTEPADPEKPPDHGDHPESFVGTPWIGQPTTAAPTAATPPTAVPPTRRAMGVTGLLLSVGLGALAAPMAGIFLVVPFVVSAVAALVALHFSAQVGRRFAAHDLDGARSASHTAMVWAAVTLALVAAVVGVGVLATVDYVSG